jgi:hypothetical protein
MNSPITSQTNFQSQKFRLPFHGWLGLALVIIFWILNWRLPGLRTQWTFFPLWLGYCLVVDALVVLRKGTSLWRRSRAGFVALFFLSIPAWWLFELINQRTQNWFYLGTLSFTPFQFALLASVNFSTVIPSIFGTAELFSTFDWLQRIRPGLRIAQTRRILLVFFTTGWIMLGLLMLWPGYFFPFLWLSIYFILEPINAWRGYPTLARFTARGNWRPVIALWIGGLVCGLFWEMWNFYSYPKWVYQVPFVGFGRLFEMPILGYGGYMPFAMELFAGYHLVTGLLGVKRLHDYLHIEPI